MICLERYSLRRSIQARVEDVLQFKLATNNDRWQRLRVLSMAFGCIVGTDETARLEMIALRRGGRRFRSTRRIKDSWMTIQLSAAPS